MTANRRIFLNIIATYGRSLYALVVGLFTARWILLSLGQVDYGLLGVVGGLMAFISFFNGVLGGAICRFYAFSVGAAKASNSGDALEECRKWFNTALTIHSTVPFALMLIGYPVGVWAIRNWLTIPADRIADCIWVFRFTCFSCFVGMANVPFHAMYTAKQYIAELTIYSFITTTLNFIMCFYMVNHPGVWLVRWSLWMCLLSAIPQLIICWRACMLFPECVVSVKYFFLRDYLKRLGSYAGWQILGCFCNLLRTQGITILINKFFGPKVNSSMTIANTVNAQSSTLSSSLLGAFSPAITNSCGAKDYDRMYSLVYKSAKFGTLLNLLFVVPLVVELPAVLTLWLKDPPAYTAGLCMCMIAYHIADVCTNSHMVVVNASGDIVMYQKVLSAISIFTLPVAALCLWLGGGPYWVGYVLVLAIGLNSLGRVYFAKKLLNVGVRYWVFRVICPLAVITMASCLAGWTVRYWMPSGFLRIIVSTIVCELVFLPISWFLAFDRNEKSFVLNKLSERFKYVPFLHR